MQEKNSLLILMSLLDSIVGQKMSIICLYKMLQLKMKKKIKIHHVKRIILSKDALAINIFGFILAVDSLTDKDINHELIHTAQMKEMLYIFFYIWYGIEWFLLFLKYHNWTTAYYHIRFEQEAYRHGDDLHYLSQRKHFNEFRKRSQ